ncbi:MAG: PLD nuclease N-terminal domain-containing protein [Xanthomonadales bacterium]
MYELALSGRGVVFVLVVLGLDVWALVKTWRGSASNARKIAWSAIIVLLPLLGLVIWALAGPRVAKPDLYDHEPP